MDITTDTSYAERPLDGPVLFTTMNHNKVTLASLIVCLMHVSPKMIIACTPQTCTFQIHSAAAFSAVRKLKPVIVFVYIDITVMVD